MAGLNNDTSGRFFPSTPNPSCYYPSTVHEVALAGLVKALEYGEPFALLIGQPGLGKTLLAQVLLERLENPKAVAFLPHARFENSQGLLQGILFDLGLRSEKHTAQELRMDLTEKLYQSYAENGPALIIQDEAHLLQPELLEEYRLIGNLETGSGRAAQVVLLAQPDILETLRKPYFESFKQRLSICPSLEPLGKYEAADYLIHHSRIRRDMPGYFTESALEKLVSFSCGIPRILNQVGEISHQQVVQAGQLKMDLEHVQAAIELLKRPWLRARENREFDHFQNMDRVQGPDVRLLNHGGLGWTA
ncbi:MAG: hypothetical protein RL179_1403 [Planctomycetota bacterium]|jgi:type II secretory pathway predicted ATPase ExeA